MAEAGQKELFQYGVVIGTHGLRGDLRVRPLSAGSTSLEAATEVVLRFPDGGSRPFRPLRTAAHKGLWLLRLAGYETLEAARELVGCEVLLPLADLPDLEEDEYYWHQLEGLRVVDVARGELGTLTDLFSTAAHDIYVVQGPYGEVLVPAVGQFVLEIDLVEGLMTVDLPEGLVQKPDDL